MENSTLSNLHDDLDSFEFEDAIEYVAAITGNDTIEDYRSVMNRSKTLSSIASAKILSNMIHELQQIIAYTPALIRPTPIGEILRDNLSVSLESLHLMRYAMIESHKNDEGYTDKKIIKSIIKEDG
tara:strand:- start:618 stop:995 length:378 start_codon:yes stop_codon:yes gene_type:complete